MSSKKAMIERDRGTGAARPRQFRTGRGARRFAPRAAAGSSLEEGKQVGVDLVLMRGGDAVRRARIVDLLGTLDQPRGFDGGILDRNDLVVFAMQNERRHVELPQVFRE